MFVLFQKWQFVYPNKVHSPVNRQFPPFSILGHATILNFKAQVFLWGKKFSFVLGFLARDIPNHSFVQNTIEPGLAWEGNRAAGMSRDPRKKGSFHVSSSQLMQTLKTARTNNNKHQIILSLTFYVWTIKENRKRSKHRKLPRNPS